jgi:hypothetical protein
VSDTRLDIHVTPDGHSRPLGNLPRTGPPPVSTAPLVAIPEGQWVEFDEPTPAPVKDQDGYGACNGFAATTAFEQQRYVQGKPHVVVSPWYVYAILCNGIDRGSIIADALKLMADRGSPPDPLVPYGTIRPARLSADAHAQAKRFRIEIGRPIRNFAQLMTAVQLRRPCNFSVRVGAGFDRLDSHGVVGYSAGWGNHAVATAFGAKRTPNGWALKFQNSWSARWGRAGFGYVTARHIDQQSWFDAYEIIAVEYDPTDPANPTPVAS